ncbi:glycine betaine ABC transporter substrate-binding protein [Thermobifida halotolerans]|uniref:Glycine betaine ABC transporter substrate-binding protein n=1 Tax=Thermobifida halotolerans TaxID=483545 RepID=A0A399FVX4_9ACTN|nr:glycine betaine ABC transporter substrate-binding protein [Thermobifida halotolerans]UOE18758.1 glycine betaine ABC transporter substrate-binding protein [Thermobifida halotolerans]
MKPTKRTRRLTSVTAGLASLVLLATACGGDGGSGLAGGGDEDAGQGGGKEIEIALIPWEEAIATTHMWEVILEELDYEVTITEVDVAPMYQGVANGDIDMFLDTWLPATHADYWEEYGDQVEDLGVWYDNAVLTLTVPSYVEDVDSIADLADNADMFDGRIVGIESGSGLVRTTKEEAIPTYGLDDYELIESSTAAMLAELDSAIAEEEPIVVTLWRPHIAYAQYDLKDLEDPEGAMGGAEEIHAVGRAGFGEDFPELTEWLGNFELSDEELSALEQAVLADHEDDPQAGAREWLAANPEFIERTLGDAGADLQF